MGVLVQRLLQRLAPAAVRPLLALLALLRFSALHALSSSGLLNTLRSGKLTAPPLLRSISSSRLTTPRAPIRLLSVHEVADVHKEPGIVSGYVPHGSPWLCLRSLFLPTNETLNFWTHFLPGLYFVWRLAALTDQVNVAQDPFIWPYVSYMVTACLFPLVSSAAHTFSAMSERAAHFGFFVDYAAISVFSFGAGLLQCSYSFPTGWASANTFLWVCFFNTVVSTFLACSSRFLRRSRLQTCLRVLAFGVPYAWDNIPLVWRLRQCETAACRASAPHHLRQMAASVASSFFYGTHFPELLAPGSFDLVGHSHNLLHVLGTHATLEQMRGGWLDVQLRRHELDSAVDAVVLQRWATAGFAAVLLINVSIVAVSAVRMNKRLSKACSSEIHSGRSRTKTAPRTYCST